MSETAAPVALDAYRAALAGYTPARLIAILGELERPGRGARPSAMVDAAAEALAEPQVLAARLAGLGHGPRLALGLIGFVEATSWAAGVLAGSLKLLNVEPVAALTALLERGLLALRVGDERGPVATFERWLDTTAGGPAVELVPHPSARAVARTVLPKGPRLEPSGPVRQVREADGLEPILRLAALWQRVGEAPLRRTQDGDLYKRDRERLDDDPVVSGPVADALSSPTDLARTWLSLARGVGLLVDDPRSDRIVAAPAEFWREHAVHLPQMIAAHWFAPLESEEPIAALRTAALLWLATLAEGEWTGLDDLQVHLDALAPGWGSDLAAPASNRGKAPRRIPSGREAGPLEVLLLGPAYLLALVRAAEEALSGRRVVQLTDLGRYALALGPSPSPRPTPEHFLYVQPNFEMIAYRQGLNPLLVGQLSRFAQWTQLGSALELKLTPQSVYRGLEGGLRPEQMLDRLARHSARPLPAGVAEALRTWSGRRERVSYHATATLIEFATPDDLRAALDGWSDGDAPIVVSDRLLLVEAESTIPFAHFRLSAARDYRRPPEPCVAVEPDGVTLAVDPGRSDLFIDAELARFAEELPRESGARGTLPRRRFRVSPESLRRACDEGLSPTALARWFVQRTGSEPPPAVRLLQHAVEDGTTPWVASRPLVLRVPAADLLDGLAQHPATRDCLGPRLGPTAVVVPEESAERLRVGLASLGLELTGGPGRLASGATRPHPGDD